ncbi:PLDX1-like protein, partial [Mya arenaria]
SSPSTLLCAPIGDLFTALGPEEGERSRLIPLCDAPDFSWLVGTGSAGTTRDFNHEFMNLKLAQGATVNGRELQKGVGSGRKGFEHEDSVSLKDASVISLEERHRRQSGDAPAQGDTTTAPNLLDYNIMHDDHTYYRSTMLLREMADSYWVELLDQVGHTTLSDSHRTAVSPAARQTHSYQSIRDHVVERALSLSLVSQVRYPTVCNIPPQRYDDIKKASLSFIYMSPFIHKFLTATQYIAPLMANFDTKTGGKNSTVVFKHVGFLYMSPFLHQWLTATQYIAPLMANFDLSVGNNSEILIKPFDQKFVVEWRDVHLQDQNDTGTFRFQVILHYNGSIIFVYKKMPIRPSQISDRNHKVAFGLSDAFYYDTEYVDDDGQSKKRRTIYEYHRVVLNTTEIQEGTVSGSANCSMIPTKHPEKQTDTTSDTLHFVDDHSNMPNDGVGTKVAVIVIVIVLVVILVGSIAGWIYYAYTHPTSASGMWLMEHRPSQMKAKMANMKFWKSNGAAGDKYAVESSA